MEAIGIPIPLGSSPGGPSSPPTSSSAQAPPQSPSLSSSFSGRGFGLGSFMRRPRAGTVGSSADRASSPMLRGLSSSMNHGGNNNNSSSSNNNDETGAPSASAQSQTTSRTRSYSLSSSANPQSSPATAMQQSQGRSQAGLLPVAQRSPNSHSRTSSAPAAEEAPPQLEASTTAESSAAAANQARGAPDRNKPHHIRLVPHLELSSRSLHFEPTSRSLRPGHTLKIGRFNERSASHSQATNANALDCSRIAFKSKVVSRQHAEFYLEAKEDGSPGALWVKDTKSSSGSFLNHIRLSGPGLESRLFQVRDGDVFQLGVDYQGGTEEMYRCVKMRVEINRNVQKGASQFNVQAFKRALGNVGAAMPEAGPGGAAVAESSTPSKSKSSKPPQPAAEESTDCCICLFAVSVCQALFIAPCSHVYHYKCIRPLLQMHHPGFSCPLCRTFADLDADVDDDQLMDEGLNDGSESSEEGDGLPTSTMEGFNVAQLSAQQQQPPRVSASDVMEDSIDPHNITAVQPSQAAQQPSGAPSLHSRRSSLHSRRAHGSSSHLPSLHSSTAPDAGEFESEMRRASLSVAGPHGHSAALGHIAVTGRSSRPGSVRNVDLGNGTTSSSGGGGGGGAHTPGSERRSLIHLPSMDEIASPLITPSPREEGPPPEMVATTFPSEGAAAAADAPQPADDEGGPLSRVRTVVESEQQSGAR